MEPIARGVAARGHEVHLVAPYHPKWSRAPIEGDVHFHLFRYAPIPALNVFGYAEGMRADVRLRGAAVAAAPLAMLAGWRCARSVARKTKATIVHAHWVIPGGAIGAAAAGALPLVVSLHGSDVFVAERHALARAAAGRAFRRASAVTACSEDLRTRAVALGAPAARSSVVPYGVDSDRFKPGPDVRAQGRALLGVADDVPVVFALGRLVKKKGFEYLIDAAALLKPAFPSLCVAIAGDGDLRTALRAHAENAGVAGTVRFLGVVSHDAVPALLASADVVAAPSVHDDAGNVDGLPNTVMEALASATPLVATPAGGIGAVTADDETASLVPERDARALAAAIERLLRDPRRRIEIGTNARAMVSRDYSWAHVAETLDAIYAEAT